MPQDSTNLVDILLVIFGLVIAGFAIGGAVHDMPGAAGLTTAASRGTWVVADFAYDIVAAQPTLQDAARPTEGTQNTPRPGEWAEPGRVSHDGLHGATNAI